MSHAHSIHSARTVLHSRKLHVQRLKRQTEDDSCSVPASSAAVMFLRTVVLDLVVAWSQRTSRDGFDSFSSKWFFHEEITCLASRETLLSLWDVNRFTACPEITSISPESWQPDAYGPCNAASRPTDHIAVHTKLNADCDHKATSVGWCWKHFLHRLTAVGC